MLNANPEICFSQRFAYLGRGFPEWLGMGQSCGCPPLHCRLYRVVSQWLQSPDWTFMKSFCGWIMLSCLVLFRFMNLYGFMWCFVNVFQSFSPFTLPWQNGSPERGLLFGCGRVVPGGGWQFPGATETNASDKTIRGWRAGIPQIQNLIKFQIQGASNKKHVFPFSLSLSLYAYIHAQTYVLFKNTMLPYWPKDTAGLAKTVDDLDFMQTLRCVFTVFGFLFCCFHDVFSLL